MLCVTNNNYHALLLMLAFIISPLKFYMKLYPILKLTPSKKSSSLLIFTNIQTLLFLVSHFHMFPKISTLLKNYNLFNNNITVLENFSPILHFYIHFYGKIHHIAYILFLYSYFKVSLYLVLLFHWSLLYFSFYYKTFFTLGEPGLQPCIFHSF